MTHARAFLSRFRQREQDFDKALRQYCHIAAVVFHKRYIRPEWEAFSAFMPLQKFVVMTAALTVLHFGIGLVAYIYEALFQLAYDPTLRRLVSEAFFLVRSGRCVFPLIGAGVVLSLLRSKPRLAAIVLSCVLTIMTGVAIQDFATQDWDYSAIKADGTPIHGKYLTWWWYPGM